jgi:hypothetical protein
MLDFLSIRVHLKENHDFTEERQEKPFKSVRRMLNKCVEARKQVAFINLG